MLSNSENSNLNQIYKLKKKTCMPLVSIWKHLVHTFNYFDMRLVRPITLYMELKQTTTATATRTWQNKRRYVMGRRMAQHVCLLKLCTFPSRSLQNNNVKSQPGLGTETTTTSQLSFGQFR